MDVVDFGETQLGDQGVVGFGEAGEIAAVRKIDFVGTIDHADLRGDGAVFAERIGSDVETAADGTRDFAAGDGDAAKIFRAVIVGDEIDGVAVGGEARAADAAIESECENFGFAAGGGRDGEMVRGVDHGLDVGLR